MILTIRTDKPEAEVGLFIDGKELAYETWQAHRKLSETIHEKIETVLRGCDRDWSDISAIACYKGPGSFTGLRIGLTVANALAYCLQVPIIAESGSSWLVQAFDRLQKGADDEVASPDYGRPARVTQPKK